MNKTRMETVAKYATRHGITKTVKKFLDTKGGYCYSFTGSQKIMRNAVKRAVKWFNGRQNLKVGKA